ncbi:MAG: aldo/keto reductase [Clostridia bacterium]|nr:aldo/keto reductase [Clostridia bacterium]
MLYRDYKNEKISVLGMGNMRLPVVDDVQGNPIDYKRAEEIIDFAMANGITYYDTAYVYHQRTSEDFLGDALVDRYPRDSFKVATKFNINATTDYVACFEEQLKKLHTDYIDFYLIHAVNADNGPKYIESGCIEYFKEQKAKGRIKNLGFSAHASCEYLREFADYTDWDFAQIQLNYFDWTYGTAKEEYEILRERNLPIVVMESIRGGRLSALTEECDALLKGRQPDMSVSSWALRWLMTLPGIQVVLSGMSTMDQIKDNVATFDKAPLNEDEVKFLLEVCDKFHNQVKIPCTACRYCTPGCPMGIEIPTVLSIYNKYKVDGAWGIKEQLEKLTAGPKDCINCGACMVECPQSIKIPEMMAEFAEVAAKL